MNKWRQIPDNKIIQKTVKALAANGIEAFVVENGQEAKKKALEFIPEGSEVMTMTSTTLAHINLAREIDTTGKYNSIRKKLNSMNRETQDREMKKLGAAPKYVAGSVHAVTQDGKIMVASNTGSQLPAYVYGAEQVIWVIGAQKIVKDIDQGFKRLYEHTLPLESERAHKVYGVPGSFISKLFILNREINPGRIKAIIVKEVLGF